MPKVEFIDIVNLNADASSLSSARWLEIIEGGKSSILYRILNQYVIRNQKITLGIPGSNLAELASINPSCISIIQENPEIFEIIYRPYVHDLSILWDKETFMLNVVLGKKIIDHLFNSVTSFYLPPEFILANNHLYYLKQIGIKGIFIHPERTRSDYRDRIPDTPYNIRGSFNSTLNCIPFTKGFNKAYLNTIQELDSRFLANFFKENKKGPIIGWRDGESTFFIPNTISRVEHYIQTTEEYTKRIFLKDYLKDITYKSNFKSDNLLEPFLYFPANSLIPWFKDFRLIGYIDQLKGFEKSISNLSSLKKLIYLQLINSDILSSVEKNRVKVSLKSPKSVSSEEFIIWRQNKHLEGDEFLELFSSFSEDEITNFLSSATSPWHKRLKAKIEFIQKHNLL